MNTINEWLDEPKKVLIPSNKEKSYTNAMETYYTKKEIRNFKRNKNLSEEYTHKFINNEKTEYIYIPEDTRRYEADNIFKCLINHCIKNDIIDIDNNYLFSSLNKNSFYEFVYNNTRKKTI